MKIHHGTVSIESIYLGLGLFLRTQRMTSHIGCLCLRKRICSEMQLKKTGGEGRILWNYREYIASFIFLGLNCFPEFQEKQLLEAMLSPKSEAVELRSLSDFYYMYLQ